MSRKEEILLIDETVGYLVTITNRIKRIEETLEALCEDVGDNAVTLDFSLWSTDGQTGPDATMGHFNSKETVALRYANKEFFKGILKAELNGLEKDFDVAYNNLRDGFLEGDK